MPKLAKPRSQMAVFCKRQWNRIGFAIALFALLCCSAAQSYTAENLECPEIGPGRVPDLIGDAIGGGLFATENRIELANEINDAINRLQVSDPNISWSDVQNVLIAAYCRVVARETGLAATERWGRMRQFVSALEQQTGSAICSRAQSDDLRTMCAGSMPISAIRPEPGPSRGGLSPRSSGIPENFISASASS